jgi:hypothetical protein
MFARFRCHGSAIVWVARRQTGTISGDGPASQPLSSPESHFRSALHLVADRTQRAHRARPSWARAAGSLQAANRARGGGPMAPRCNSTAQRPTSGRGEDSSLVLAMLAWHGRTVGFNRTRDGRGQGRVRFERGRGAQWPRKQCRGRFMGEQKQQEDNVQSNSSGRKSALFRVASHSAGARCSQQQQQWFSTACMHLPEQQDRR